MRKSGFSLLTTLIVGVCALPSAAFAQDAPAAPAPDANAAPAPPAPPAEAATPPAPTYPATTITGFVEGGYNHVFGAPHNPTEGDAIPTRAYDPANGFVLHLAHLSLKHQLNEH